MRRFEATIDTKDGIEPKDLQDLIESLKPYVAGQKEILKVSVGEVRNPITDEEAAQACEEIREENPELFEKVLKEGPEGPAAKEFMQKARDQVNHKRIKKIFERWVEEWKATGRIASIEGEA